MTDELRSSMTLREFLRTSGTLAAEDRMLIARQALVLLESNYAHLPLKAARYAVNPVQRLRLLIARLSRATTVEPEWRFHAELLGIFDSLHDLHTRYVLPEPFADAKAFLPFRIKEFTDGEARHFIVAPPGDGTPSPIPTGAEIVSWNGVPIERAVDVHAERMPGANPAARHARALDTFTVRSVGFTGPPDEEFVLIQYVDVDGTARELRQPWQVVLPEPPVVVTPTEVAAPEREVDLEAARLAGLRILLFAPRMARDEIDVPHPFDTSLQARVVPGLDPPVGHLRIRNFTPPAGADGPDVEGFVNQFLDLLAQLPPNGLILDIRGNPGGNAVMAELCLQALTPRRIDSEPLQFICSPLNLSICRADDRYAAWLPSMEQAVESGAVYSAGVPPTPTELLDRVPQGYIGPVVLLTDARVYSAADRFAAGFQDNGVGPVLGVDPNTGAGGANVWHHKELVDALSTVADSPYRPLPAGTDISVAMRRTLRVGPNTGAPVEDFGVRSDEVHVTTRADILEGGVDLMAHAARLLAAAGSARRFDVTIDETTDVLTARFDTTGVDRADLFVDGRPRESVDLSGGTADALVPGKPNPDEVRVEGFADGRPVAVRVFRRDPDGLLRRVVTLAL
jgi:C-terminal processing protease CtpA/Prc